MFDIAIVWFRRDLRLHDHEVIFQAAQNARQILPVYCFDPREYGQSRILGLPKTGSYRAQFILESVQELKEKLSGKLHVALAKPEDLLPELLKDLPGTKAVFASKEFASEELAVESALGKKLAEDGVSFQLFENAGLFKVNDLPFPVEKLPEVFTVFRTKLEKRLSVRPEFETENLQLNILKLEQYGEVPTLAELGLAPTKIDPKACLQFKGGESQALERLFSYFWEKDLLKRYKNTRNGLLGPDYSSKFSAWLACGALSAVRIYHEVKRYEKERIANESTYWLIFELFWREFFRFSAVKHADRLFYKNGLGHSDRLFKADLALFEKWKEGRTGVDFVDANMRELAQTGFMSNRGRQNVASYLCKTLGLDWRYGAEYFETQLIDYDVYSNWGNWAYIAGVGHDPRDRVFNIERQAQMYDPEGKYTDYWLERPSAQQKLF